MLIIDIEASGLGDESYPIEIAWGHRHNPTIYDSFLICPPDDWTHWDTYAESNIHHISRETLLREGISVVDAVARLDRRLAGTTVYSDYVPADRPWIVKLYKYLGKEPTFRFCPVQSLIQPDKVSDYLRKYDSTPTEHRALADVRKIIRILNYISAR
ncbi:3'-5' exonuclease [Marinobacter orientalis]|uniref:Exonuclease domain-containing protein n=1 Tax=Marinobacter orientalis TaxID=1928859 RepID=A0A7Y0WS15_9GAMM|nr:hypothetical protein [Marinobacter orientalis]NMT63474.1 hypothetical protein [Marinobacter orientalis]TGX48535.1 hypothetical protein DIT72_14170 [Marinobacter orientalis]